VVQLAKLTEECKKKTAVIKMEKQTGSCNIYLNTHPTTSYFDENTAFEQAHSFNGDLSLWDTSSVTNMEQSKCMRIKQRSYGCNEFSFYPAFAFYPACWSIPGYGSNCLIPLGPSVFNGDISSWDTSSVVNMDKSE
jgi:surface protein